MSIRTCFISYIWALTKVEGFSQILGVKFSDETVSINSPIYMNKNVNFDDRTVFNMPNILLVDMKIKFKARLQFCGLFF